MMYVLQIITDVLQHKKHDVLQIITVLQHRN